MNARHARFKVECPQCACVFDADDHKHRRVGNCERCGAEYETHIAQKRYCSAACQRAAFNEQRRTGNPTGRPRKRS